MVGYVNMLLWWKV